MSAPVSSLAASVVVASYQRARLVSQMLDDLAAQTVAMDSFEVVLIDDGSAEPVTAHVDPSRYPFALAIVRQANTGPAAARDRGARLARGDVLVFLDDDMRLPPTFLAAHLAVHATTPRAVVVGLIRPAQALASMPLFERFHAGALDVHLARLRATRRDPVGMEICSGNLSMRRDDYLRVGGFDATLGRSEDAELGVRLEKSGCQLRFSEEAYSVHDSDHTDEKVWLRRAFLYGVYDTRIGRKHPDVPRADPWHWLDMIGDAVKPPLFFALALPRTASAVVWGAMRAAQSLDARGRERPALALVNLAYALQYFRGVRAEEGFAKGILGYFAYRTRPPSPETFADGARTNLEGPMKLVTATRHAIRSIKADHQMMHGYDQKYAVGEPRGGSLLKDLIYRAGFQMMVGVRLMRFCKEAGVPVAAKLVSRGIRFIYGSDLHWDAQIADGVCIIHGYALGICAGAKIGPGVILAHCVSIGEGRDPETKEIGAPTLEENVHLGPASILLGPIVVGKGSKVAAGAVLRQSVPPGTIVEAPLPRIRLREPAKTAPVEHPYIPPTSASAIGDVRSTARG
jgi:serine acetyltransferase/GT2 family glycosyltransferase